MYHFANLQEAEAALAAHAPKKLRRVAYTTEHAADALDYLGNPQNACKAVHIVGTSGKTSTAYYTAALLRATGKRVGLMVSPHIESLTERVQINLEPLSDKTFCEELSIFFNAITESGVSLTSSELLYAFAFWEFARMQTDYIVIEAGLGGLNDATNVMTRPDKVCIITDIGLDHTKVLGETLEAITTHKAGVIGLRNAVFCHAQSQPVLKVIQDTCRQKQADLHIQKKTELPPNIALPLFQRRNASLALACVQYIIARDDLPTLTDGTTEQILQKPIPGRMELVRYKDKIIILDGAHNPQKLAAIRESVAVELPEADCAVLVSFIENAGRSLVRMLKELQPLARHCIVTTLPVESGHAAYTPQDIATAAGAAGISSVEAVPDIMKALDILLARSEKVLLVTGSLYALQYVRPHIRGILRA